MSEDARILILTGATDVERLGLPPHVSIARLPGPHRSDQKVLATAVEIFRPEVLLVDHQPFGAGGELGPALELVRAAGGQAILGLPDVLDDTNGVDLEWRRRGLFDRIPQYFGRVLVYGQPDVLDPVTEYAFPPELSEITSFCGYVVSPPDETSRSTLRPVDPRPRVLASAGDGDPGFALLDAFVAAADGTEWKATVVVGAHLPMDRRSVLRAKAAAARVAYRKLVPELPTEFASLDALACMGGYNTLAEAVAGGVPTVCVPKVEPTREQLVRARAFESRGLVRVVEPADLDPERLRAELEAALAESGRPETSSVLDLGGARRAAHHLLEVASGLPSVEVDEVPWDLSEQLAVAATS